MLQRLSHFEFNQNKWVWCNTSCNENISCTINQITDQCRQMYHPCSLSCIQTCTHVYTHKNIHTHVYQMQSISLQPFSTSSLLVFQLTCKNIFWSSRRFISGCGHKFPFSDASPQPGWCHKFCVLSLVGHLWKGASRSDRNWVENIFRSWIISDSLLYIQHITKREISRSLSQLLVTALTKTNKLCPHELLQEGDLLVNCQ